MLGAYQNRYKAIEVIRFLANRLSTVVSLKIHYSHDFVTVFLTVYGSFLRFV